MKQSSSICFLVFLFLLVFLSTASSSFLSTSEVKEEVKHGKVVTQLAYSLDDQMETTDSLNKLMGLDGCEEEDGECFKRRIIAEAHLDYIYTQNHNHP